MWSRGTNSNGALGYFGGDGFSNLGPQQTSPRQVLFGDGIPSPPETESFVTAGTAEILLDKQTVTAGEVEAAMEAQEKKESAEWFDLTDENIKMEFLLK